MALMMATNEDDDDEKLVEKKNREIAEEHTKIKIQLPREKEREG